MTSAVMSSCVAATWDWRLGWHLQPCGGLRRDEHIHALLLHRRRRGRHRLRSRAQRPLWPKLQTNPSPLSAPAAGSWYTLQPRSPRSSFSKCVIQKWNMTVDFLRPHRRLLMPTITKEVQ